MEAETARLAGMVFACVAAVSTVVYYVAKFKELRVLREIRDRLPRQQP